MITLTIVRIIIKTVQDDSWFFKKHKRIKYNKSNKFDNKKWSCMYKFSLFMIFFQKVFSYFSINMSIKLI